MAYVISEECIACGNGSRQRCPLHQSKRPCNFLQEHRSVTGPQAYQQGNSEKT